MNKKILIISSVVLLFISTIGITYAVYTWGYNTKMKGSSNCFEVVYTKGRNIGNNNGETSLVAGYNFSSGLSTSVVVHLNEGCSVSLGKGTLYLNTEDETSDILLSSGALKYQVIDGNSFITSGTLTSKGNLTIYNDFNITYADRVLTVIVWLDKSLINGTNEEKIEKSSYKGYISLDVESRG